MRRLRWIKIAFVLLVTGLTVLLGGCPPPCEEAVAPGPAETFTIEGFGTITTLGTLGPYAVHANGLNASGQIAGWAQSGCSAFQRAVLSQDGDATNLGTLGGGGSRAYDINGLGQVVGTAGTGGTARVIVPTWIPPGVYVEPQYLAFIWQDRIMVSLGTLPEGVASGAVAINDVGQVVGWAELPYEAAQQTVAKVRLRAFMPTPLPGRAVLWQAIAGTWQITDLRTYGIDGSANDINNLGQVVGTAKTGEWTDLSGFLQHAYLLDGDALHGLGTLGGDSSEALAVNDAGQVAGWSETGEAIQDPDWPRAVQHAFLWRDGEMIDLGTLGGNESAALDINNLGQIVGWSETSEVNEFSGPARHAFLWQAGVMTDLNRLLPADSEWEVASANAINDAGRILATALRYLGRDQFGHEQAEWHSVLITLEP